MAPIIPQNTNPYSTPTENSKYTSQSNPEKSHQLFGAAALGLGCSLIGPGFLAIYYASHGSQMTVLDSSLFFGLVYILPSLLTLGAAFPLGLLVSHKIPTFKKPACQLITSSLTITYFTIAVSALLSNRLNYGVDLIIVDGMPIFSVICSVGTFLVVTVYLAITKPVTS